MIELLNKSRMKALRRFWLQLLRAYFRLEVEGLENIPRKGRALIVANHSGFAGADALLLAHVIKRETKRRARILAHRAFFDISGTVKDVSENFGLRKASIKEGTEILGRDHLVIIFPEGERGNFKPTTRRYQLQKFRTGFLRMAAEKSSPIIPCAIIGAEESHLNLGNIDFSDFVKGLRIPLPLNIVPLPAKWKIVFLPAIEAPSRDAPEEAFKKRAHEIQMQLQAEVRVLHKKRPYVYTRQTRALLNKATGALAELKMKVRSEKR